MNDESTIVTGINKTLIHNAKAHGFEIVRLLARGGMGEVFEAFQPSLKRKVAAKRLLPEFAKDFNVVSRFEQEAFSLAQMNHPNIVQIIDYNKDDLTLFLEFIEGCPLDELLEARGEITLKDSLRIVIQIADGLEYAHRKHIVHRDMKPGNIILSSDGQVKIADFGIAKIMAEVTPVSSLTEMGQFVGTPLYASPEQCLGGEIDGRSDIYSTGIILYKLVTGQLPFVGTSNEQTRTMQVYNKPMPPVAINTSLPAALNKIILKAIEKRPEDRFQSALEFKTEIEKFLKASDHFNEAVSAYEMALKEKWFLKRKPMLSHTVKLCKLLLNDDPSFTSASELMGKVEPTLKKIKSLQYMIAGSMGIIVVTIVLVAAFMMQKKYGTIDLMAVNFDGQVFLDGKMIGNAPFVFTNIKTGKHQLYVEEPGFYRSPNRKIVIEEGKVAIPEIISPPFGRAVITSTIPNKSVKIDNTERGNTPLKVKLTVGPHNIEVDGNKKDVVINLEQDETISF